jgi:hypothetical protein
VPPPPLQLPPAVVTDTAELCGDMPAESAAATVNRCVLAGCNPKIEALVPKTLLNDRLPLSKTL